MTWQPIETAPLDKRVLLWWTPVNGNKFAEAAIIGEVSSHFPGTYWDGGYQGADYMAGYKPLDRVTHWMLLPPAPVTPNPTDGAA